VKAPRAPKPPKAPADPEAPQPVAGKITGPALVILLLLLAAGVAGLLFEGYQLASHLLAPRAAPPPPKPPPPAPVAVAPPPAPPGDQATPTAIRANTLVTWTPGASGKASLYRAEGVVVRIENRGGKGTLVTLTAPGGRAITVPGGRGRLAFGFGRLDPASHSPQVYLASGPGGGRLIDMVGGQWRTVDLGEWAGGGGFPGANLEYRDDRFAAFGAGGERAPPLIKTVREGRLIDVSSQAAQRPVFEAAMRRLGPQCEKADGGACAAYVASAARIGQSEAAWRFMLAHADRRGTAGLPTACRRPDLGARACPAADTVAFASYPEALRWFLGENGYMPRMPLPPPEKAAGASYDCNRAGSFNLGLICNDTRLAAADREMARLYARALSLEANPAQVREEQQAFQERRDGAAPDRDVLQTIYAQRIAQLKTRVGP
jgi:hypothetical protein